MMTIPLPPVKYGFRVHRLVTLGPHGLMADGDPVELPPLEFTALVYLALRTRKRTSKDELIELFWGGRARSRSRHSLSQIVYSIKSAVPQLNLKASRDVVTFDMDMLRTDVDDFLEAMSREDLETAAMHYNGAFLEDLRVRGAKEIRFWIERRRAFYAREARRAFVQLARVAELEGNWAKAERYASRLLHADPLDSDAAVMIACARAAQGDKTTALATLGKLRHQDRRSRTYSLKEVADLSSRIQNVQRAARVPSSATRNEPPFVGRSAEINELWEAWQTVTTRIGSSFVLVGGEAGIGKTRLLDHFARLVVIRGGRAFVGRCRELERRIVYAGLADLLVTTLRPNDVLGMESAERRALAQIVPKLAQPCLAFVESTQSPPPLVLFEAAVSLFARIASKTPLLLVLDDAHWADEGTLAFIQYAARRLRDKAVLFLLAFRPDEAPYGSSIQSLVSSSDVASYSLSVNALAEGPAYELVERCSLAWGLRIAREASRRLVESTHGQPLFIIECLREMVARQESMVEHSQPSSFFPISRSLRDHVGQRLSRLRQNDRMLLHALAVLNAPASADDLATITKEPFDVVLSALSNAEARSLIQRKADGFVFVHDLLRHAIYGSLPDSIRLHLHSCVADHLVSAGDISPGVLALHFQKAARPEAAFGFAVQAAKLSIDACAFSDAEHYCSLAATCAQNDEERNRATELRFRMLLAANRPADAAPLVQQVEHWYRTTGDRAGLLRLSVAKLEIAMYGDAKYSILLHHLDQLWQTVYEVGDVALVGQTVTSIAAAAHHRGRRDLILALLPKIEAHAIEGGKSRESGEMYALAAKLQCVYGDAEAAWTAVAGAEHIAHDSRDRVIELLASIGRGVTELIFGDLELSRAAYARAHSICQEPEMVAYRERVLGDYGWVLFEVGQTEEAISVLSEATRNLTSHRMLYALANLCLIQYETSQFDLLKKSAQRLIEANSVLQANWVEVSALAFEGLAAIGLQSHQMAHMIADRLFQAVQRSQVTRITDSCWVEIFNATYLESMGYGEHAVQLLSSAVERAEPRDRLIRFRLRLQQAKISSKLAPDRAWRLCRDLEIAASECNAMQVSRAAKQLRLSVLN